MAHDVYDRVKLDTRFLKVIRALVGIFQLHRWHFFPVDRAEGIFNLGIKRNTACAHLYTNKCMMHQYKRRLIKVSTCIYRRLSIS